ncbi:hypothetical protein BB561_001403 [Smittium simulii]|uniref:Uncharacterized protein n=1 Tax=Smittium simulii TaxID=133385 RepID=A0A2T9YUR0_9FUNG|nr:hypothetical protein BB561_001403 [Smittium simulii]
MSIVEKGAVNQYLTLLYSRNSYILLLSPLLERLKTTNSVNKLDSQAEPQNSFEGDVCQSCSIYLGPHIYQDVSFYLKKANSPNVLDTIGFAFPDNKDMLHVFPNDTIAKLYDSNSRSTTIVSFSVPFKPEGKYLALTLRIDGLTDTFSDALISNSLNPITIAARELRGEHIVQQDRLLFWQDFEKLKGSAQELKLAN